MDVTSHRLGRLLVRADASSTIGLGHVMRCLALAQEWRDRAGSVAFALATSTAAIVERLHGEQVEVIEVDERPESTARVAEEFDAHWVTLDVGGEVDGYLTVVDRKTLVIDDEGRLLTRYPDLLVNQNIYADSLEYGDTSPETILRGLQYALFRDEFLEAHQGQRPYRPPQGPGHAPTVLLTLGGTDPARRMLDTASGLVALVDCGVLGGVELVTSIKHPDVGSIAKLAERHPQVRLHQDPLDMAAIMARVDLAITAGGTTVWELALLGVPALVGAASDMELRTVEGLRAAGLFRVLGDLRSCSNDYVTGVVRDVVEDPDWRLKTGLHAQSLVDGHGRRRVVEAMVG